MREVTALVVFSLEEQRCALPLMQVERVVRAAEITPLPDAPRAVMGCINVEGNVLPVLDLRQRFGFPERALKISDEFLIARTANGNVVLAVDRALETTEVLTSDIRHAAPVLPGLEQTPGVAKLEDGLVLIHDLERFLSQKEARTLNEALAHQATHGH